jgi:hypothetical protein
MSSGLLIGHRSASHMLETMWYIVAESVLEYRRAVPRSVCAQRQQPACLCSIHAMACISIKAVHTGGHASSQVRTRLSCPD